VTHVVEFQRDVTARVEAVVALQQAKAEAERANLAKSEFIGCMSHELRTPLHAILGHAQLLEMERQNPGESESVTQIVRAGNHLLGLINEVLDIARVESGKVAPTPEPVRLRAILEEAVSLVHPLA